MCHIFAMISAKLVISSIGFSSSSPAVLPELSAPVGVVA
jgi:hypothetical protein